MFDINAVKNERALFMKKHSSLKQFGCLQFENGAN
jgi:hypothetical protein